ncbi:MAG: 50S ribosomal protein L13 [Elusimicrobia bacterium]|nr:50S ribosomal protein L13 [Elusimicrobiota bacterium]
MPQKTFYPEVKSVQTSRRWHHIDADGKVLGRLATQAASFLKGKHKPIFTPNVDCGDFVVVTNAKKIKLTGNKIEQKVYFSHSGWPKGARLTPVKRQMEKDPRKVVYLAVKRMLHANKFRSRQLKRFKIYTGGEHPHAPQVSEVSSSNG